MSASLLKKSLEIVEASSYFTSHPRHQAKKGGRSKSNPFAAPSTTEQQSEYRGVKKSKLKAKAIAERPNILTKKAGKSAIQVAQESLQKNQSRTDENLQKLLMLSSVKLDEDTTNKLIRRAQNKRYVIPETKPVEESSSVFTNEDFAKFEREYFCK